MHCVMWTYAVPPHLTEPAIREQFANVAGNYLDVPGLVRKYFGLSEDATTVIGIYLWESREDADRFYSPEWMAGVTERWGAEPRRDEWIVPVVAETTAGEVVS
jgi:heme-degrading monooxygenase HmoA